MYILIYSQEFGIMFINHYWPEYVKNIQALPFSSVIVLKNVPLTNKLLCTTNPVLSYYQLDTSTEFGCILLDQIFSSVQMKNKN